VPNDYSNKAYEDLVVTKGKGFTKEKNKKKRGAYKGGYLDTGAVKSIKFED
jgi:SRP40, C-terminal domain